MQEEEVDIVMISILKLLKPSKQANLAIYNSVGQDRQVARGGRKPASIHTKRRTPHPESDKHNIHT